MSWQEDFFEVNLDQIPMPEIDPTWDATKAYSRVQIEQWLSELDEIQRRSRDQGWRAEDFENLHDSAIPAERSLCETYHKFYHHEKSGTRLNNDFVKLDWTGDHYEITNGQHRIWLAKERGLRTMPASVSAPDQETLNRLRGDSERLSRGSDFRPSLSPIWERRSQEGQDRARPPQRLR